MMQSMPAPSILFLVASDWYFYCHRLALARRVAAAGYDVHVATPPGRYCGAIEAAGLRHHPIQMVRQGRNPFQDVVTVKCLVDLYRRHEPMLVHHVALKPIVYGSIAAKITKVPAIVNAMPGMGFIFLSDQFVSRLIRPGIMAAFRLLVNAPNSRVILQNLDDQKKWIGWGVMRPDRIVIIPGSGIDTDVFRPNVEPPGPPLVILPARLLSDKGVGEFVEAARLLHGRGVKARFALVGEGDPGNPASVPPQQLHEWEDEGVVELFGWHDDMPKILAHSHIVCLPSYGEGLPKALLEAASCGKPIVATDVPGCRDVVHHGENGLLVPPRQAAPLATALERLIGDADLRRTLGVRGRERVLANFSVETVSAETLRLYADLLGSTVTKKSRPMDSIENDAPVGDSSV
jgi:glycosyltransferase involved in cell wall biosynthesis